MSRCPLCLSQQLRPHLAVGGYQINACQECGWQGVDPLPSVGELAAFYNDASYFSADERGYNNYLAGEASLRRLAHGRLHTVAALMPVGKLLDVGCAAGFFLQEAKQCGWSVAGVELSDVMRGLSAGVAGPEQMFATSTEAQHALRNLDLVTMWEYIEHVPDPLIELRRAAAMLRPGGLIAISTPNTAHWLAQKQPKRWREYKPPAHLTFFSAPTLVLALERVGFAIERVRYTTPLTTYDGIGRRMLEHFGARIGTGAERKTRYWPLYSLLYRVYTLPARLRSLIQPERYCVGLELYARRRSNV